MDKISPERRSANMRAIKSKHTKPELVVRQALRQTGFTGYRLHRNDLPGRPDIVFVGRKKAIFVHGCFWHGHECLEGSRQPKSRPEYWNPKIEGNQARGARHVATLCSDGWDVLIIWGCEVLKSGLSERLADFLSKTGSSDN